MTFSLSQKLGAEFLGTAMLVATVVGSGIMGERLADGNDAIALLGNTLATGAILFVLITMLGPISGAHFNPAVSLVFALKKELSPGDTAIYMVAQITGGLIAVWATHFMFEAEIFQASQNARTGPSQWFSEGVATFGLVTTILLTIRARPEAVATAVGLYITAGYWFTSSTSFANPAVTIARSFTDSFSGIQPIHMPGFILAQIIGAVIALGVCSWLLKDQAPSKSD